ncbi:MAG: hypothetical protein GXP54_10840 [Deltaproteobacteria bacterium]|nr:hypothetical protein [Deltaproteobacteria bacterium]
MRLLDRILKFSGRSDDSTELRIRSIRFRRLLEDVRSALDIMADAREKRDDEFIFDRHYVTALVDRLMDAAGKMVMDAAILAPRSGSALYDALDSCRGLGQASLLEPAEWNDVDRGQERTGLVEPEYRMLDRALEWMNEGAEGECCSIQSLVDLVFECALDAEASRRRPGNLSFRLDTAGHRFDLLPLFDGVVDAGDGPVEDGPVSEMDVHCRPLGRLLMGSDGNKDADGSDDRKGRRWAAVVSPEHLDAVCIDDGAPIHVTATMSLHADSDFAFAAFRDAHVDSRALPSFTTRKAGRWTMIWRYGADTGDLEEAMIRLGGRVFGPVSE